MFVLVTSSNTDAANREGDDTVSLEHVVLATLEDAKLELIHILRVGECDEDEDYAIFLDDQYDEDDEDSEPDVSLIKSIDLDLQIEKLVERWHEWEGQFVWKIIDASTLSISGE